MRYGSLIILLFIIFTGCKSDKVELPEQVIPIPVIQGVWESMSCYYGQSYSPPNSPFSINNGFRFDTIYKTDNHIRIEINVKNQMIITYKNGNQNTIDLEFIDMHMKNDDCLISVLNLHDNTVINFHFTKSNNSLSCEYDFSFLKESCVNNISRMVVNFVKK